MCYPGFTRLHLCFSKTGLWIGHSACLLLSLPFTNTLISNLTINRAVMDFSLCLHGALMLMLSVSVNLCRLSFCDQKKKKNGNTITIPVMAHAAGNLVPGEWCNFQVTTIKLVFFHLCHSFESSEQLQNVRGKKNLPTVFDLSFGDNFQWFNIAQSDSFVITILMFEKKPGFYLNTVQIQDPAAYRSNSEQPQLDSLLWIAVKAHG